MEATNYNPPGLGNNGGNFGIFKYDSYAGGNYGFMSGIQSNGDVWMQVQRRDGTATAYNLLLQPSGGNVGIGTASPGYQLQVNKGAVVGGGISIAGTNDTRIRIGDGMSTVWSLSNGWATAGDFSLIEEGVSGSRIYVKPGGNVGIGTTSPLDNLFIGGTNNVGTDVLNNDGNDRPGLSIRGNYPEINIVSSVAVNTRHGGSLRFVAYDNTTRNTWKHWVIGTAGQNATFLDFGYAPNNTNPHYGIDNYPGDATGFTVMRINNAGNVGIGTTAPGAKLDVVGDIKASGVIYGRLSGEWEMKNIMAGACLGGSNAQAGRFITYTTTSGQTCATACANVQATASCAWGTTIWAWSSYYGYNYECTTGVNYQQGSSGYICCCSQGNNATYPIR